MACRCNEIEQCEADKKILTQAQQKASDMFTASGEVENCLVMVENISEKAYVADNMEDILDAIDALDDAINPAISGLCSAIAEKMEEVEEMEQAFREEDSAYHASLTLQE